MQVIPAIDIINERCVRLSAGDYSAMTVYDEDPHRVAMDFFARGARRLHLVDLDAAKDGAATTNRALIGRIAKSGDDCGCEVDVGGGLRDIDKIKAVLDAGARFAVLGTAAVRDEKLRELAIREFPERIIIGIDCKQGQVAVNGWIDTENLDEFDFLARVNECPPAAIIYTDIERDGMLRGVNVEKSAAIAAQAKCPVIASGGVSALDEIEALSQCGNISGAIVGKAIYNGDLDLNTLFPRFA